MSFPWIPRRGADMLSPVGLPMPLRIILITAVSMGVLDEADTCSRSTRQVAPGFMTWKGKKTL